MMQQKKFLDNSDRSEPYLMGMIISLLYDNPKGMHPNDIRDQLFPYTKGKVIDDMTNRMITQLNDLQLISFTPGFGYALTGKGIKTKRNRFFIFNSYPYITWSVKRKLELILTKYLPILISILALVVSIFTYYHKIKSN